jgi:hypothetical protein
MTEPVRLAVHGRRADGAEVDWTLSEGRRGRRWREVVVLDGVPIHALLLETGPDRRFTHLELSSATGLATLHPEGDGTLHGNVVSESGVRHVVGLPFAEPGALTVAGSIVAGAALAWGQGLGLDRSVVVLDPGGLDVIIRQLAADDLAAIDADGAPRLDGGRIWPLEV